METNQPIDDDKPYKVETLSKKELADKYNISEKTLKRRLRHSGLIFPHRILLPAQVFKVIEKLGYWDVFYSEP